MAGLPPEEVLCVAGRDPLSAFWTVRKWHWVVIFACLFIVFTIPQLLLSWWPGGHRLGSSPLSADVAADWKIVGGRFLNAAKAFPPSHGLALLLGVHIPSWARKPPNYSSPSVEYLRDYPEMAAMLVAALHTALVQRQWKRLTAMVLRLREAGALHLSDIEYRQLLVRFRAWFFWKWRIPLAAGLAAATSALSYWSVFGRGRLFAVFQPPLEQQAAIAWQMAAFTNWWANWHYDRNLAAAAWMWLSWGFVLYYLWLNLHAGLAFVWGFRKLYLEARTTDKRLFDLQADHPDRCAGLGPIKAVLVDVVWAVLLMTILIGVAMAYGAGGGAIFIALWTAVWVAFNSAFIIPLVLAWRILKTFKQRELLLLHAEMEAIRKKLREGKVPIKGDEADRLAFLEKLFALMQACPEGLFSWRRLTASVAVTAAPFIGVLTVLKGFSA